MLNIGFSGAKLVGLPSAITLVGPFYPIRPLVSIREWPCTILPEISRSFRGKVVVVSADPFLGVVYKLSTIDGWLIHWCTIRLRSTEVVLRIQQILVRNSGLNAKVGCLDRQQLLWY